MLPIYTEGPTQVKQNGTIIPHIQHVSLIFDQEDTRELQETDSNHDKLIVNIKLRNKIGKGDYSWGPHGVLFKKVKIMERNSKKW